MIRWILSLLALLPGGIAAEDAPPEAPAGLTFLSYNIRHGQGMDGKIDLERIATIIRKESPDLVALQEIDKNCRRSGKIDIAAELGRLLEMEHRFGKFMDFQGGEYGLAVLSKLPILETIRHPLPEGAEPRCALEVKVRAPGFEPPVSFVSIHHDWTREDVRVKQVAALMEALAPRRHPVMLAGDFNGERDDASMRMLEKAGWLNLVKEGRVTFSADEPKVEIDFFVVRGFGDARFSAKVIDERMASDHRPIVAQLLPAPSTETKQEPDHE